MKQQNGIEKNGKMGKKRATRDSGEGKCVLLFLIRGIGCDALYIGFVGPSKTSEMAV